MAPVFLTNKNNLTMSNNNIDNSICPALVFNDYFSSLSVIDALTLSILFTHRVHSEHDDNVSICLCHPANDTRSEAFCRVLRGLRDVASSMNFRFVFYVHTDEANLGASLDIFRISMSLSFFTLVSQHFADFMRSYRN